MVQCGYHKGCKDYEPCQQCGIESALKLQELVKEKTTELNTKLKEMDDKDQFHAMPSYYHQKEHARDILQSLVEESERCI